MVKKFHTDLACRLGRNIAAFRQRAGLNQEQLAERIEVEISTLSRYETGATLPSLVTLENLAVELHRSYGTEAQCEAALTQVRWPSGFVCPQCGSTHAASFRFEHEHRCCHAHPTPQG